MFRSPARAAVGVGAIALLALGAFVPTAPVSAADPPPGVLISNQSVAVRIAQSCSFPVFDDSNTPVAATNCRMFHVSSTRGPADPDHYSGDAAKPLVNTAVVLGTPVTKGQTIVNCSSQPQQNVRDEAITSEEADTVFVIAGLSGGGEITKNVKFDWNVMALGGWNHTYSHTDEQLVFHYVAAWSKGAVQYTPNVNVNQGWLRVEFSKPVTFNRVSSTFFYLNDSVLTPVQDTQGSWGSWKPLSVPLTPQEIATSCAGVAPPITNLANEWYTEANQEPGCMALARMPTGPQPARVTGCWSGKTAALDNRFELLPLPSSTSGSPPAFEIMNPLTNTCLSATETSLDSFGDQGGRGVYFDTCNPQKQEQIFTYDYVDVPKRPVGENQLAYRLYSPYAVKCLQLSTSGATDPNNVGYVRLADCQSGFTPQIWSNSSTYWKYRSGSSSAGRIGVAAVYVGGNTSFTISGTGFPATATVTIAVGNAGGDLTTQVVSTANGRISQGAFTSILTTDPRLLATTPTAARLPAGATYMRITGSGGSTFAVLCSLQQPTCN